MKSLTYFDDADKDVTKVQMLKDVTWNQVKKGIVSKVKDFHKLQLPNGKEPNITKSNIKNRDKGLSLNR